MRLGQEVKLPDLMEVRQVNLTGKPATTGRYCSRYPMIGMLWTLSATGPGFATVCIDG